MLNTIKRKNIDLLVEEFWKLGYLTVSRKYGTYLPEPSKVGKFEVDIVARQRKNYAIGITLTYSDLNDPSLIDKLNFLATRQTKYSNKRVILFVGVPRELFKNMKVLIDSFNPEIKNNIKLFEIIDRSIIPSRRKLRKEKVLFS
ncbi:MAG: hypothetical protein WCE54_23595 [Ignavibacteriaceae bacterium]